MPTYMSKYDLKNAGKKAGDFVWATCFTLYVDSSLTNSDVPPVYGMLAAGRTKKQHEERMLRGEDSPEYFVQAKKSDHSAPSWSTVVSIDSRSFADTEREADDLHASLVWKNAARFLNWADKVRSALPVGWTPGPDDFEKEPFRYEMAKWLAMQDISKNPDASPGHSAPLDPDALACAMCQPDIEATCECARITLCGQEVRNSLVLPPRGDGVDPVVRIGQDVVTTLSKLKSLYGSSLGGVIYARGEQDPAVYRPWEPLYPIGT